ncbi:MAG: nickel-dependent lactate racemase [Bacteroidia bacterium]|nr:nickel-dependent lactate racemase [Bacteroidia bacterium]
MTDSRSRNLSLRFGAGVQEALLPHHWNMFMPGNAAPPARRSGHDIIQEALREPIGAPPLRNVIRGGNIVVLVPDKTRRAASDLVLPLLLDELTAAGVRDEQVSILFATGTHAGQSPEERAALLGEGIMRRYRVVEHDSRDTEASVYVGRTKYGTPILLNRLVVEADLVLIAGTVVHHYFAGFGGGPKMFLPGVAAYESAVANHRRTITEQGTFHPACRDGNLVGNPVAEDIADAVRFFPPSWYFAAILDEHEHVAAAVCGDLMQAHASACASVHDLYSVSLHRRYPLCIASAGGYPKDVNLIQAHKALHHAAYTVEDGGALICLAECPDGIGNSSFLEWFRYANAEDFRQALLHRYTMNAHTALALKEKTSRLRVILVTALDADVVAAMGMEYAATLADALELLTPMNDLTLDICVLRNASLTVPVWS